MVWQSPNIGAMSNGGPGGGGGMGGSQEHSGPVGTEYTLQGVMRFLQIEWHNHERARNAWDIERAEMKAKIAKQEGDVRNAKKLNEQLDKQIRMLERALKAERSKKAAAAGENVEDKEDAKGKAAAKGEVKAPDKPLGSFLELEGDARELPDQDKDTKDKSHLYLQKTLEEVTYLLTPPAQPPPPQPNLQSLSNSSFMNPAEVPLSLEEVYMQQRAKQQQQQQQQQQASMLGHPSAVPNHQPPPVASNHDLVGGSRSGHPQQQAAFMSREVPSQMPLPQQPPQQPHHLDNRVSYSELSEEPVEKITHSYDNLGRPIPSQEESTLSAGTRVLAEEQEGWNFEDTATVTEPSSEMLPHRRPDQDLFPSANNIPVRSPPRSTIAHRRKSSGSGSMARRRSDGTEANPTTASLKQDPANFKVRFALRGHLDVVRSVIFTGGGSPSEPEICTAGDDGMIKRWIIPASYTTLNHRQEVNDLDIQSYFTHRGHDGAVTSLAACPVSASFSTGGRASGDGWIFSGGQDASIRVWERGRVDPKATLEGHTDAIWAVCVLPATSAAIFGSDSSTLGGPDRILLASGSADGTVKIWAVSAPPQLASPQAGSRRGAPGSRRHSVTSGSNFPSSPQPSIASNTPFHYTLVHSISRAGIPSPTCIAPLAPTGETFVVAYNDASILIYDTRTGEEVIGMASAETYDGTAATGINAVVAIATSQEGTIEGARGSMGMAEEEGLHGATGSASQGGVEGVIISGHEDRFIRFFDANSGQCTYSMLAHPSAISSLSLSKDGREAVSAGHDASIRFWSLEKRICTQEITSHRVMRGEGVCSVVWSQDSRLVVSAGGDGVVKVFAR